MHTNFQVYSVTQSEDTIVGPYGPPFPAFENPQKPGLNRVKILFADHCLIHLL